jgi:hypothetical protein
MSWWTTSSTVATTSRVATSGGERRPAILAILEHAPASLAADVILEVPTTADIRPDITAPEGVRVHWVACNGVGRTTPDSVSRPTDGECRGRQHLPRQQMYGRGIHHRDNPGGNS